jgi:hypothetical protein
MDLTPHRHTPGEEECLDILHRYKAGAPIVQVVQEVLGQQVEENEAYRILALAAEVHPDVVSLKDLLAKELPDSVLVLSLREVLEHPGSSSSTKLSAMKLAHGLKGRLGKNDPRAVDPRDIAGHLFGMIAPVTQYPDAVDTQALPPAQEETEDAEK